MSETPSSPTKEKRDEADSNSEESKDISVLLSQELTNSEIFLTIARPSQEGDVESTTLETEQAVQDITSTDLQDILQDIIATKDTNKLNLWRGAVKCRLLLADLASSPDQDNIHNILYYWLIRLYLLGQLNAPTVFQQESRRVLEIITPHQQQLFLRLSLANKEKDANGFDYEQILWTLQIVIAQLSTRPSNDLQGLISRYYRLGTECRRQLHLLATFSTPKGRHESDMMVTWKKRLFSVGIQVALVLLEMKDYAAVMQHLLSIRTNLSRKIKRDEEDDELKSYASTWLYQLDRLIITVYIHVGDVSSASHWLETEFGQYPSGQPSYIQDDHLIKIEQDTIDFERCQFEALCLIANGEWDKAYNALKIAVVDKVPNSNDKYYQQLMNACKLNLSISSLYEGNLQESIRILQDILAHETTRSNAARNDFTEIIKLTPNMGKAAA